MGSKLVGQYSIAGDRGPSGGKRKCGIVLGQEEQKMQKHKIATLTFHTAHNFGAMLQAYALAKAVNGLGFPCEVLDYRFSPVNYGNIETHKDLMCRYGLLHGTSVYCKRVAAGYYKRQKPADRKFNIFMRKYMPLSKRSYYSEAELSEAGYDTILFGSDQIWNPALTGGVAKAYFGGCFDRDKTRLISYGASCGKNRFPEELQQQLLPMLSRFHALGVREQGFADYLNDQCGLPAETVMDPVFLLTVEQWDRLLRNTPDTIAEPYLFLYTFGAGDEIYKLAERIAKQKKLKLVVVCDKKIGDGENVIQLTDCGPLEFLRLVRNASFVCTTSFHGEAFSILFNRDFYCIAHPIYAQRNVDLAMLCGLEARMVTAAKDVQELHRCSFDAVNGILSEQRKKSLDFLKRTIVGEK